VLPLSYVFNGTEEIAAANLPQIRLLSVPLRASSTPQTDINATWRVATPESVPNFSAVCWMTARHIREMYWGDLPMGLIQTAWGGTRVEAWATPDVNAKCEPNPPADPKPQENPRWGPYLD
jgi:sialate O-acetylesterase